MATHSSALRIGMVVLASMTTLALTSCGAEEPPNRSERRQPGDPQKVLDSATKHMNDAGTGSFATEVTGMGMTIKGEFDLNKSFVRQALTTRSPDFPDGFTVRSLTFKDVAFARVSTGPASKCWMRYDQSDAAAAQGVTDPNALPSDLMYSTPPAAEILNDPISRGFMKNTSTRINADVPLPAAFSAAMPKAALALAEKIGDEKILAPVVLTVVDGMYAEASYFGGDLLQSGDITAGDLRKAGLSGDGMSPKQAFDLLSSLEVRIRYREFGQEVRIERPKKDEIADIDLATMDQNDTATCRAAEQ
ncbi:MAG: hypothetical protein ACRDWY_04770 [Actinomycetes bacterium]